MRFFVVAAILCAAGTARAHVASVSYVDVAADGTNVELTLRLASRDLFEALALDRDRDATDAEIVAGGDALARYAIDRLHVSNDGAPCPLAARGVRATGGVDRFAEIALVARCGSPPNELALTDDVFFDLDARHLAFVRIGGATTELTATDRVLRWTPGTRPRGVSWIARGMEHIYTGYDHIAFLLALLVVAARRRDAPVVQVLKIVTGFTAGHSLTLILAATGVVSLPSRVVESAIAASIVYVAAENVWVAEPGTRWPLALGFGLVHGLGFASVLRPILPAAHVAWPLLLFNVGVELGQLTIVAVVLPALIAAARASERGYRRVAVLGSLAIGAAATLWLVERVLDVRLLGGVFG